MSQKRTIMTATVLSGLCLLLSGYQNCQSRVGFGAADSNSGTQTAFSPPGSPGTTGTTTGTDSNPLIVPPVTTSQVLKAIKPALAVRGAACLLCHANVSGNIVTDFGSGDPWFLGANLTNNTGGPLPLDGDPNDTANNSWFGNYGSTWQSMTSFDGSVYIPQATIPSSIQASMSLPTSPSLSIAQMLQTPATSTWVYDCNGNSPLPAGATLSTCSGNSVGFAEINAPLSLMFTPPAGAQPVNEMKTIKISSPTESDILGLSSKLQSGTTSFVRVGGTAPVQFIVEGTDPTAYVKNDETQTLDCAAADIVVSGTLYLRNLKVNATGGCRLYVTGSVFIENNVTYSDAGATQNLQISSANFISMGISESCLQTRQNDSRNAAIHNVRTYNDRMSQALKEATNIGTLVDASGATANCSHSGPTAINYTNLLLNAPVVESRYLGTFQGTIISELALFALGKFSFQASGVFGTVDVLPLLPNPILVVQ